jgi:plastocyanin
MKGVVTVTGEAASGGAPALASAGPPEVDVGAVDFAFEPDNASVAAGGKVKVTNNGQAPHTLTLDDVDLDTGNLAPGAAAELTAPDAPGSYSYRCAVHPACGASWSSSAATPRTPTPRPPPPHPPRPQAATTAPVAASPPSSWPPR